MRRRIVVVIVLLVVAAGVAAGTGSDDAYAIALASAVDTPDRTSDHLGATFPVDAVGRVDPGEPIAAEITAPSVEYRVSVYDVRRQRQAARTATGDATVRFDTTGWEPGSYLVAVETGDDVRAIHPLVVSAYRLDVSAPDAAAPGSSVPIQVDLEPIGEATPVTAVRALVAGDAGERRVTLEAADGGYAGSVPLDGLPPGEYTLFVGAQGTDRQFGEAEIVAFTATTLLVGQGETVTTTVPGTTAVPTSSETPEATLGPETPDGTAGQETPTDMTGAETTVSKTTDGPSGPVTTARPSGPVTTDGSSGPETPGDTTSPETSAGTAGPGTTGEPPVTTERGTTDGPTIPDGLIPALGDLAVDVDLSGLFESQTTPAATETPETPTEITEDGTTTPVRTTTVGNDAPTAAAIATSSPTGTASPSDEPAGLNIVWILLAIMAIALLAVVLAFRRR